MVQRSSRMSALHSWTTVFSSSSRVRIPQGYRHEELFHRPTRALGDYDITKIYVEQESLEERGLVA